MNDQPIQPQPPVAPQPVPTPPAQQPTPTPQSNPVMNPAPTGKSGAGKTIGIIAGISAVVVALICIVVFAVLPNVGGVSGADIERAYEQTEKLSDTFREANRIDSCRFEDSTDEIITCLENSKTAFSAFESEFRSFGRQRAIQRNDDMKAKFERADGYLKTIKNTFNQEVEFMKVLAPITQSWRMHNTDDYRNAIAEMQAIQISDSEVKTMRDSLISILNQIANVVDSNDPNAFDEMFRALDELDDLMETITDKFGDSENAWDNLNKLIWEMSDALFDMHLDILYPDSL